jgi:hypothetical protein
MSSLPKEGVNMQKSTTITYSRSEGWININIYIVGGCKITPDSVIVETFSEDLLARLLTCAAKNPSTYSIFECNRIVPCVVEEPTSRSHWD